MAEKQLDQFVETYDIIDHLPNQASGFSATLLKNKTNGEYTLSFRSTEYRDIKNGGDAERDSIRGAAGDIAFNGMAFAQVSSMEKYWGSLLDGSRALGATPDKPAALDTTFLRPGELDAFKTAVGAGTKINVSGYSLGGHLATMFASFHGTNVSSLYLFNSSGVGRIRDGFSSSAYQDALRTYDIFMRPENLDAAILRAIDWARRAFASSELGRGAKLRSGIVLTDGFPSLSLVHPFLPREFAGDVLPIPSLPITAVVGGLAALARDQARRGLPRGEDGQPILASSAQHFLVSLFASEALDGTYSQTIARGAGIRYPSLQESGLIPPSVRIYQVSGLAASGAPSIATFDDMRQASDWNIVADSGIRAAPDSQLLSVYIENQPIAAGVPFSDRGWGDFGNTHSITLIVDSLAVTRMLQKAQESLPQEAAEQIFRAASNLRKQSYNALPSAALAEHDSLERVVDAFGRVLFGRREVGAIDWAKNLASADGIASFGLLEYRDPFHARIQAIENELAARGLAGKIEIVFLTGRSASDLAAEANAATEYGKALRYALKELNPFIALGPGLYDILGRDQTLALHDPASGTGSITAEWLRDRSEYLALKLRLGMADHAYEPGSESVLYTSASGDSVVSIASADASGLLAPDAPAGKATRLRYTTLVQNLASAGRARLVTFGSDGDAAANPSTVQGGADRLSGRAGTDRLYGEGGDDQLVGGAGADHLDGGSGDDTLSGNAGNDVLVGGTGYDTYLWSLEDGVDRITETREAGQLRGRIVLRHDTALLYPRMFKRDPETAGEVYRSPDKDMTLTHGTTWVLTSAHAEIDLGADLRDGDFGFRLEDSKPPLPPTIIHGLREDSDIVGPSLADAILVGGYGHDRLYSKDVVTLEAALLVASEEPLPGWGFWFSAGPGNDLAIGTPSADVIEGGGGADTLVGGPGNDLIEGDADYAPILTPQYLRWEHGPADFDSYFTVFQTPGFQTAGTSILPDLYRDQIQDSDDIVYGGSGDDRLYGGGGADLIYGDPGNDVLMGGSGSDVLVGGDGADRITGEQHGYSPLPFEIIGTRIVTYPHYVPDYGDDVIDGGAGADELFGEGGADVLFGSDGADTIYGDIAGLPGHLHGSDVLDGGEGDDDLFGQGGDDLLFGGAGKDRLLGDSDIEARLHGADSLRGDAGDDLLIGAGGADELSGGADNDTLIGDSVDVAAEWHGADVLDGGGGDDLLLGYGGADELFGSDGADRLFGDDPEAPAAGVADLIDGGNGDDNLHGHGGGDRLQGGSGADHLFGDAGDDTLAGGPGVDLLDGGIGNNVFEFSLGDGADRLVAGAGTITLSFLDGVDVSALRASRVEDASAGTAPLQIQYSPTEAILIEGLVDESQIRIRIGETELMRASELTQLTRSAGIAATGSGASELLRVVGDVRHLFALDGDDVLVGSAEADQLHGGSGHDELYGLSGNDILYGGEGADWLLGGLGDDRLEGGPGDDRYELLPADGIDTLVELPGGGTDVVMLAQGMSAEAVRLRRSGNDLVVAERAGSGRLFATNWFSPAVGTDRGIDAIGHEGGSLDVSQIEARVAADSTLMGTDADDTLNGDEFEDVVIGGKGDDVLAGLAGADRYIYSRGDGSDRIVESGGFDRIEFGAGIEPGEISLVASPAAEGGISITLQIGAGDGQIVFGEARDKRIDEFRFASGETLDYAGLLRRTGGLRVEGGSGDDTLQGSFFQDSLYGFDGNDALKADGGDDLLVGAEGDDMLAGGANDDTYVFDIGDGRDVILEYAGTDEYLLFRGYFTPSRHRAFEVDGVVFETHEPLPGLLGETFNISLGALAGGVDTIRFGEGIAAEDIRFGLDLGKPPAAYEWLVPDASAGLSVGTVLAEQVAYVLEIGSAGDAIELLRPNAELDEHLSATQIDSVPVEQLVFGDGETLTLADVFARAGGLAYILGSARDEVFDVERVLPGGWLGGGRGGDVYMRPEQGGLGILEAPDAGADTIVFGDGVTSESLHLVLEYERLFLDTGAGRVELLGFSAAAAEHALVERYEFSDSSAIDYDTLLARGIDVLGTPFTDHLSGTSAYDFVVAGAGNDRIDSGGGHDIVDAQEGDDTIVAGAGDDWLAAGAGSDVVRGGLGRDLYLYVRGDGADVIEEHGAAGEEDSVLFAGDIAPGEVSVRRSGSDLALALGSGSDGITMRDWFAADAMRVERVAFNEGTVWDATKLAALAGETLPAPTPIEPEPPAEPPVAAPGVPPVVAAPPSEPPAADPPVVTAPPGEPPAAAPPAPSPESPAATGVPEAETPSAPAPAEVSSVLPMLLPATEPIAPSASVAAASPSESGLPASSVPSASESSVAASVVAVTPSTLESLAATGLLSPGRPAAAASEAATETIAPEVVSPEESAPEEVVADAGPSDAIAAYWRWMHARLEAHLEETEVEDLGAPPLYDYRPLAQSFGEGLPALAPVRSVGIRDRAAFETRTLDGLRDGFARLG